MKRLGSTMYHQTRLGAKPMSNTDGYLFAQGRYPTKIKAEDLPEWYIGGKLQEQHVYISALGVKHLVFAPVYNISPDKDDLLYISYDKPIVPDPSSPSGKWLNGYKHILYGDFVMEYLKGVAKYSHYDIQPIIQQIVEKQNWYHEHYSK